MVDSSFLLWIGLYLGSSLLLYYGADKQKVIHLIGSTILYLTTAMYSFSFATIIGSTGTWIMIGISIMGFVASIIYCLNGLVKMLGKSSKEPKEDLKL